MKCNTFGGIIFLNDNSNRSISGQKTTSLFFRIPLAILAAAYSAVIDMSIANSYLINLQNITHYKS